MKYEVRMPITGYVVREVEADSEGEAIAAFWYSLDDEPCKSDDIEEWEFTEHVTQGNVCSAVLNSADATPIKD